MKENNQNRYYFPISKEWRFGTFEEWKKENDEYYRYPKNLMDEEK